MDNFGGFLVLFVRPVLQSRWFANVFTRLLANSRSAVFQIFRYIA